MIPIKQTNPGGRGNCMAACFASILEVPIETVPDYRAIHAAGGSWLNAINTWLSKHHDLIYIELEPYVAAVIQPRGWHLVIYGARDRGHAVVGFCGRPVWDPVGFEILEHAPPCYTHGVLVMLDLDLAAVWRPTWAECLCPECIRGDAG